MLDLLLLGLAGLMQDSGPIIVTNDPPQGPMPGENHTLSMPHQNMDDRMFPDIAVKDLRIDGETLYVLVTNQGKLSARGLQVTARAEANGRKSEAAPARLSMLTAGESKWVSVGRFRLALADAKLVSAAVQLPPAPLPALDRSGRGCDSCTDVNEANNSLTEPGPAITRGRPE